MLLRKNSRGSDAERACRIDDVVRDALDRFPASRRRSGVVARCRVRRARGRAGACPGRTYVRPVSTLVESGAAAAQQSTTPARRPTAQTLHPPAVRRTRGSSGSTTKSAPFSVGERRPGASDEGAGARAAQARRRQPRRVLRRRPSRAPVRLPAGDTARWRRVRAATRGRRTSRRRRAVLPAWRPRFARARRSSSSDVRMDRSAG